jgi:predicted amidophosphoribosyltransferase
MTAMSMSEADTAIAPGPVEATKGRSFAVSLKSILSPLADLLLPPVCIVCRARIGRHGLICGACFGKIDFIAPPLCDRLGVPLPYDIGEGKQLSGAAMAAPPVYDRARAVARYSSTMRELIQSFKYRDRHEGLPLFGRWLKKAGAELLADADLIVPVPLYSWRLWSRRFNQSAMLAREVGRLARVPVDCFALARVRRTVSQVGLSPDQRRRNVAGALGCLKPRRAPLTARTSFSSTTWSPRGRQSRLARGPCAGPVRRGSTFSRSRGRSSRRPIPLRNQPREPSYFV